MASVVREHYQGLPDNLNTHYHFPGKHPLIKNGTSVQAIDVTQKGILQASEVGGNIDNFHNMPQ